MRVQKCQGIGNAVSSERLRTLLEELEKVAAVDEEHVRMARAPGRANIIGEHADHNDGYVCVCMGCEGIDRQSSQRIQSSDRDKA
jgi:galactokinase